MSHIECANNISPAATNVGTTKHRKLPIGVHQSNFWRLQKYRPVRCFSTLNPDNNSLWKTQKILRTTRKPFPPTQGETEIARTNGDKAEAFADSLQLQCRENQLDDEDEDHSDLSLGSPDHNPVLLTMGNLAPQGDIIVKWNTDRASFRAEMQRSTAIPKIETTDDLEAAVVTLETDIRTALE
ncbi:hypothetical protein NQ315_003510 [Exocentrus adspersus]|uniref:Uncharacterized protein n=1 Tax=Exocentrus adspersus TaxID=1586481 RepID=A0AAV8V892_9CUCU|nr:hypothetical protein NQ315_003510 [Exocentrus adspersus]